MVTAPREASNRIKRRFQRQTRPGTAPGSVVPHPDAPKPIVQLLTYRSTECSDHQITEVARIPELINQSNVTWVDVDGLGDADVIMQIGRIFGLHPLTLEDVVNVHQRPKLESYGDYLFLIARVHSPENTSDSGQLAMFLGRRFVVTFRQRQVDCLQDVRQRILAGKGKLRSAGADYLLYSLLDAVIDSYFPLLEQYGERLDALDEQVASGTETHLIEQVHMARNDLLSLRRSVWPLREAVNSLIRDSGDLVSDETDLYLRDCYDHTVQIIDVIETDRELCADLRDFYLSVVSNRMNQVMKFLTVIATLFIPLSFITGLYGMNFNPQASAWNMPELNWGFGYPFALGVIAVTAGSLVTVFWRKGWLR